VIFQAVGADEQEFEFPNVRRSANDPGHYSETAWPPQGNGPFNAIFSAQNCSDGMSDQQYGISVDILVPTHQDWVHYSGCCSLLP